MKLKLLPMVVFALTASCVYAQQDYVRDLNRIRNAVQSLQPRPNSSASASSITAPADPHLLSLTEEEIDLLNDLTLSVTLPFGPLASGTATGQGNQATSISAIGADGNIYDGYVTPPTETYFLPVNGSSNPFRLQTCFSVQGPGNVTATLNEPNFQIVEDTPHTIFLPVVNKSPLGGNVAMLDPALPFTQIRLVSTDNTTAGTSFVISPTGDYTTMIPDGPYNVGAFSFGSSFAVVPLGQVTVNGPTSASFIAPQLASLTIQVTGIPIPANSFFQAIDAAAPPSSGCNDPIAAIGSAPMDMSGFSNLRVLAPTRMVSGKITDPNGNGVSGAKITFRCKSITRMPNTSFQTIAIANSAGDYTAMALSGQAYAVFVAPR